MYVRDGVGAHSTALINYAVCDLGKYSMMTFGPFADYNHIGSDLNPLNTP